ncbi:MAG: hypothetical protein AAF196_18970 [Planctomycetota bacterium]
MPSVGRLKRTLVLVLAFLASVDRSSAQDLPSDPTAGTREIRTPDTRPQTDQGPSDEERREPPPPAAGLERTTIMSALTIDFPEGFRELLPNEALDYENRWPFVISTTRPGTYEVFGKVDQWIADGFDGEAVAVARSDFERPTDLSNLESLKEAVEGSDNFGNIRTIVAAELAEVGFFDHPAIALEIDYTDSRFGDFKIFETHGSTSGDEYVIVHLLSSERLANDPEAPARLRSTLRFIAPPKDPEELPDRLINAALLGVLIAIVLLVLRKMQRSGPPPG